MYRSHTRELSLADLPPALREVLRTHAEARQLSLVGARCWLTHRENPVVAGLLGSLFGRRSNPADPDAAHEIALVLSATHLLVATAGEKRGASALSLPLMQASMERGSPSAARLGGEGAQDGLTLHGFPGDQGSVGSYFVGLGPEDAGKECARAVEEAIRAQKNPGA